MTTEVVLSRAEKSLAQLKKEMAVLEEMRRVARESLAYLKLERAALEEVLESRDSLTGDAHFGEDTTAEGGDNGDERFDPLQLLELTAQDGGGTEDLNDYFKLPDSFQHVNTNIQAPDDDLGPESASNMDNADVAGALDDYTFDDVSSLLDLLGDCGNASSGSEELPSPT
ncbi:uncharacterized protein LOC135806350 [Sycon ciliatum]|uniref:uncharacterized protein LOC135806350 n=1 Tax=Sycon ciliatum TaxID=27933 RepID=UPI0031F70C52